MKQRLMLQGGTPPSAVDQENYLELLKVLKAKPRKDRPMNAGDAHKRLSRMFSN